MNKLRLITLTILFSLLLLSAVNAAFAGGGPVAVYAFALRPFDQTKTFIIQSDVYTSEPCDQIKSSFAFKDKGEGDSITPFSPPDDNTYLKRHYYTGQPDFTWKEICTSYAQAKSGQIKQRTVIVTAVVNGNTEERDLAVSFGNDYLSKQLQSYGRINDYDNTPHLDVIRETFINSEKREVEIQWQKIAWATQYTVFGAKIDEVSGKPESYVYLASTSYPRLAIIIEPSASYYLNVIACKADDPCATWKENTMNGPLFLDKMRSFDKQQENEASFTIAQEVEITPFITPIEEIPYIIPKSSLDEEQKIEALNKKVAELENKLNESKKKQSFLEQRLSDILSLLKRLLPFLK